MWLTLCIIGLILMALAVGLRFFLRLTGSRTYALGALGAIFVLYWALRHLVQSPVTGIVLLGVFLLAVSVCMIYLFSKVVGLIVAVISILVIIAIVFIQLTGILNQPPQGASSPAGSMNATQQAALMNQDPANCKDRHAVRLDTKDGENIIGKGVSTDPATALNDVLTVASNDPSVLALYWNASPLGKGSGAIPDFNTLVDTKTGCYTEDAVRQFDQMEGVYKTATISSTVIPDTFTNTGKKRQASTATGDVVDKLHSKDSLTDTGATDDANLATLDEWREKVDNFNARF